MKIFSWNVNGIRAVINKGEFAKFVDTYQPDIICLQETKAQQGQAVIDLPEYEEYWNSAEKKGYSGTAIFTKVKPISVINGLADGIAERHGLTQDSYGDPAKEGRVLSAEFDEFWLVTAYTPNSKRDLSRLQLRKTQWDPAFLEHVQMLEQSKPVLFCGDLNVAHTEIDLARPKDNLKNAGFTEEERSGFDAILGAGFLDTFRMFTKDGGHYTWWTAWGGARANNVGWRIDYFLASGSLKDRIKNAAIHNEQMGSDHCPVSVEIV